MRVKTSLVASAATTIALFAFALALLFGTAGNRAAVKATPQDDSKCYYAYRGLSSGSSGGGGSWDFECGNQASASAAYRKCINWIISEYDTDEKDARDSCSCHGCNTLVGSTSGASPRRTSPRSESETPRNTTAEAEPTPDTSDADETERAKERARAYENQKKGTRVNPNGSLSVELVRKDGESDEDFRARQRAAEYEKQKREEQKTKTARRPACSEDKTYCIRIRGTKYNAADKSLSVTWENVCNEDVEVGVCYVYPYEDCHPSGHGCSFASMSAKQVETDTFPLPKPPLYPLSRNVVVRAVKPSDISCSNYVTNCPNRPRP